MSSWLCDIFLTLFVVLFAFFFILLLYYYSLLFVKVSQTPKRSNFPLKPYEHNRRKEIKEPLNRRLLSVRQKPSTAGKYLRPH